MPLNQPEKSSPASSPGSFKGLSGSAGQKKRSAAVKKGSSPRSYNAEPEEQDLEAAALSFRAEARKHPNQRKKKFLNSRKFVGGTWFLCAGLFLGLFAGAYLTIGAQLINRTNTSDQELRGSDQRHNIKLAVIAKQIRENKGEYAGRSTLTGWMRKFPNYTDGVVSPLWPWVGSFLVPEGIEVDALEISASERLLFERGKRFLVVTSCLVLVVTGAFLLRFFSLPAVFVLLLTGGLGALLQRSAFYQPEVLSYIFLALSWVLALFLLKRNCLRYYLLLGVCLGLAYLAKTSIQPIVGGFLIATTLRWIVAFRTRKQAQPQLLWNPTTHLIGLCVLGFAFCLVTAPRLLHSKQQYGSMTHTYPSYWMWMDRFEDAYLWMGSHGNAEAIKAAGSDAPSFLNYLKNHTLGELTQRFTGGTADVVGRFFSPPKARRDKTPHRPWKALLEHRGTYLGLLALLAAAMALQHALLNRSPFCFGIQGIASATFLVSTFVIAALAYGWYSPIGKGDRFMLSLYLPLVISLIWACERLHQGLPKNRWAGQFASRCYLASMAMLCAALVWRTIEILEHPEFT